MKRLAIFGTVIPVLKKAKEMGFETIVIDANPNLDKKGYADYFKCIEFNDYEGCLNYLKTMNVDGVLNATEFAVIISAYVTEKLGLPGMKLETAKRVKNKYEVRKFLKEKGIQSIPQFFEISNISELDKIKDEIKFPVIIKPAEGLGSLFVYKINNYEELKEKCEEVIKGSFNNKALIETYINGQEYGVESFVYNGKVHVLSIMEKLMTKNGKYRVELGHCAPADISHELEEKIKDEVTKIINILELNYGPVNMDLIVDESENSYIVDIGARMGGNAINTHIIPNYIGVDHVANTIKLAMNDDTIDLEPKFHHFVATRQLDLKPGKILELPEFSKLYNSNVVDICFEKKVGDTINEYTCNAERSGFIIVTGDSIKNAKQNALELRNKINELIKRE